VVPAQLLSAEAAVNVTVTRCVLHVLLDLMEDHEASIHPKVMDCALKGSFAARIQLISSSLYAAGVYESMQCHTGSTSVDAGSAAEYRHLSMRLPAGARISQAVMKFYFGLQRTEV